MMVIKNEKTGVSIAATHMPFRKKMCLTIIEGNTETKYATFNNDEAAEEFMKKLVEFVCGLKKGFNWEGEEA